MDDVAAIIFITSLFIIVYAYAGYPLLVWMLVCMKRLGGSNRKKFTTRLPPVTLIVTAYNEEALIRRKIENCFALDYPSDLLTIMFVTDGSSDDTCSILREYPRILLLHEPRRMGKLAAMNRAVGQATTEHLVFSDANTFLNRACIRQLVRHYGQASVGAVAGEKRIAREQGDHISQGEGMYWRYESLLKKLDADFHTAVGAAGELFSIRKSLYTVLPADTILEDFVQSLSVCLKGHIVQYEPDAYAEERASLTVRDEMERKIRISAGGFQAMTRLKPLFNVLKYPILSFQFISHRVLRWTLCPVSLILLFLSSLLLSLNMRSLLYEVLFGAQLIVYMMAATGWQQARQNRRNRFLFIPFYFVFMNLCVFAGLRRFLRGQQSVIWEKAKR